VKTGELCTIENKDGDIDGVRAHRLGYVFPNGRSVYHRGRTLSELKVRYSGNFYDEATDKILISGSRRKFKHSLGGIY